MLPPWWQLINFPHSSKCAMPKTTKHSSSNHRLLCLTFHMCDDVLTNWWSSTECKTSNFNCPFHLEKITKYMPSFTNWWKSIYKCGLLFVPTCNKEFGDIRGPSHTLQTHQKDKARIHKKLVFIKRFAKDCFHMEPQKKKCIRNFSECIRILSIYLLTYMGVFGFGFVST